jgi:hypothetical protein
MPATKPLLRQTLRAGLFVALAACSLALAFSRVTDFGPLPPSTVATPTRATGSGTNLTGRSCDAPRRRAGWRRKWPRGGWRCRTPRRASATWIGNRPRSIGTTSAARTRAVPTRSDTAGRSSSTCGCCRAGRNVGPPSRHAWRPSCATSLIAATCASPKRPRLALEGPGAGLPTLAIVARFSSCLRAGVRAGSALTCVRCTSTEPPSAAVHPALPARPAQLHENPTAPLPYARPRPSAG